MQQTMSTVSDVVPTARDAADGPVPTIVMQPLIPGPRAGLDVPEVPDDVLDDLRHITECYLACRTKANVLRAAGSTGNQATDRERRDELARALQRLHELRERRSALLDAYDLPSTAGRDPEDDV